MKTTLSLVVTLIFGAMLLVSFQTDSHVMPADVPVSTEAADHYLLTNPNPLVPGEGDNFYNYPDPFCGVTTIHYLITQTTQVRLFVNCPDEGKIKLVNQLLKPGAYSVEFDACNLPCGDYTAYLVTDYGKFQEPMKKIMSTHKPPVSGD
jgi:hypothetical protein